MPKKADDTLKTKSGIYKSQLDAASKYTGEGADANKEEAKVESIRLRVPKGWKELIEKRAEEYPVVNAKGNKSVNNYICDLIRKDIGIEDSDN